MPQYIPNAAERALISNLREGYYKQGRQRLRPTLDTFCCLGVACEVLGKGRWEVQRHINKLEYIEDNQNRGYDVLVDTVRDKLGWLDNTGTLNIVSRDGDRLNLTYLNDNGFTFSQIADVIEAGLVRRKENPNAKTQKAKDAEAT